MAFLVLLVLAAGTASWLVAAITRLLEHVLYGFGPIRSAANAFSALAYLAISLLAFSFLLGNWFEVRESLPGYAQENADPR